MATGLVPRLNARTVTSFLVAVLLLVLAWPAALGGATSYVVISGISMQPLMETGDLAIVRRADSYEVGDVIAFRTIDGDVIHRVIGGNGVDGYETQGDNVAKPDPYSPTDADVRGRRLFHIPKVGAIGLRVTGLVPPWLLGAGVVGLLLMTPAGSKKRRRVRPRRRGPTAEPELAEDPVDNDLLGRRRLLIAAACALMALAVLPSVVVAWATPTRLPVVAGAAHRLELTIVGIAVPGSATYPSGRTAELAPDAQGVAAGGAADAPLVRAELSALEVVASYALDGAAADTSTTTTGTIRVDAQLQTRGGESLPLETGAGAAVGATGSAVIELDLAAAEAAFAALPDAGQDAIVALELRPVVALDTPQRQTLVGDTLRLELTDGTLAASGPARTLLDVGDGEAPAARVGLLGITLPTTAVRVVGTLLLLGLGGAAAWLVRQEQQEDPELGLQLRYSSLLVELAPGADVGGTQVPVASMTELARLAKRDQRSVLHRREDDGSHRYLVPDGELTYTFVLEPSPAHTEAAAAADAPASGPRAAPTPRARSIASTPAVDRTPSESGTSVRLPRRWEVERADDVELDSFEELAGLWREPTADGVAGVLERHRIAGGQVLYALLREGQRFTYLAGADEPLRSTDRSRSARQR